MFRTIGAVVVAVALTGSAAAQAVTVKAEGPVTIPTAQQIVLHSPSLDRDFMIRVQPPAGPPLPAGTKAAAVYVLDGNLAYGMAGDTMRLMSLEGQTWPAYVIAIGYDTTNPAQVMANRELDYLHTQVTAPNDPTPNGGGGVAFEKFVLDELKPFIEARLQVDPAKSVLAGHSYGGLFVSNLIARRPDGFAAYMIGSPSVWSDRAVVESLAKVKGAGRRVFIGVGEKEVSTEIDMVADAGKLAEALTLAGFSVTKRVHPGQTHGMEPNIWFAEGFRDLLARPKS